MPAGFPTISCSTCSERNSDARADDLRPGSGLDAKERRRTQKLIDVAGVTYLVTSRRMSKAIASPKRTAFAPSFFAWIPQAP